MALKNGLKWVIIVQDDFPGSSGRHRSNTLSFEMLKCNTLSRQEFSIQGP
jgi:hypothetical protein